MVHPSAFAARLNRTDTGEMPSPATGRSAARSAQTCNVEARAFGRDEPRASSRLGLVQATTAVGAGRADHGAADCREQPADGVLRCDPASGELDERFLHDIFRRTRPLPRVQDESRGVVVDQPAEILGGHHGLTPVGKSHFTKTEIADTVSMGR